MQLVRMTPHMEARGHAVTTLVKTGSPAIPEMHRLGLNTISRRISGKVNLIAIALLAGIEDGTVDAIASDHRPQDQDSKRLPFAQAACGVIGVQTMLPVCLRLVHAGELRLLDLLRTMTEAPARILGIDAGRLAKGAPADLVLFDPDTPWKVTEGSLKSLSKNTAFEGRLVEGRVARTMVDGRTIYQQEI